MITEIVIYGEIADFRGVMMKRFPNEWSLTDLQGAIPMVWNYGGTNCPE
ncbi:hypothetical protein [Paenibacillus sp. MBLB4367]